MTSFLADTTVLVEHLRGNNLAKSFLEKNNAIISSVTKAELVQGSRNKTDLKIVKTLCNSFVEAPINEKITKLAISLLEKHYLSHGLLFLDALIAATALERNLTLITGNTKHFTFIPKLLLKDWSSLS